jgi:hypothetical protein
MKKTLSIKIKICGIQVENIALRRKIVAGHIQEVRELVITLPAFGTFPIDDDIVVSIYDSASPQPRKWEDIPAYALKEALLLGKFTKN